MFIIIGISKSKVEIPGKQYKDMSPNLVQMNKV